MKVFLHMCQEQDKQGVLDDEMVENLEIDPEWVAKFAATAKKRAERKREREKQGSNKKQRKKR